MRNLKKILALVLALVMSLSLMATASAADFTDASSINEKYETAVEVLEGLGVFRGYQDGSFQPTGSITRAETAAIIYRIVTGDVKDEQVGIYADYNLFTDVPSTAWFAGYVNYCANAEYIKGVGGGKFNPNAQVTGYAALAMILRAIGYTANGGFTGPDWEVQTARVGEARKITKNILTGTLGQPATRESVAEILFQAILVNMVDHNVLHTQNGQQGYTETNITLGYKTFGLEQIEGVVMANEYANLYTDKVLAKDKTQLKVAGEENARTLAIGTKITDIGESRYAYVTSSKVLAMGDTGKNKVTETGAAVDITIAGKFSATAEMPAASDIEYYSNFEPWTLDTTWCDQRLEFSVVVHSAAALNSFNTYTGRDLAAVASADGDWVVEETANYVVATPSWDKMDAPYTLTWGSDTVAYRFTKIIYAGTPIKQVDLDIIEGIFGTADNKQNNLLDKNKITGDVYVGTKSTPTETDEERDLSNSISYKKFLDEYIKTNTDDVNWGITWNGWWTKFIDNDGDGDCDYAFRTNYGLNKALYTFTDRDGNTYMEFNDFDDELWKVRYLDGYTPAVGDKVLAAYIDGQWLVEPAKSETVVVSSYSWRNDEITTDKGTYGQSGIRNATDMLDLISTMEDKITYVVYFDHFGYVRAYELPGGKVYALITEMYYTNGNQGNLVKDWPMTAELTTLDDEGKTVTAEYNVIGGAGTFTAVQPWMRVENAVATYNYNNWLQPVIPHLGVTRHNATNALADYDAHKGTPTFTATVDNSGDTMQANAYVTFWNANRQLVRNIADNGMVGLEEFNYGAQTFAKLYKNADKSDYNWNVDETATFTNVAVASIEGSDVRLAGAATLNLDTDAQPKYFANVPAAYATDYIQLAPVDIAAKAVRYPIDATNAAYAAANNIYVNAVHDTQYFIAFNGGVVSFKDYENFPGLTNKDNKIHAAYAVARNIDSDKDGNTYWAADVIVYEVYDLDDTAQTSISLAFYTPTRTSGNVQEIETLNSKYGPEVTLIPGQRAWSADRGQWGAEWEGYGFYALYNDTEPVDGVMTARDIDKITIGGYAKNNIHAGTIIREAYVEGAGQYIDVDMDDNGVSDVSIEITNKIYSITKDQDQSNRFYDYNFATLLRYQEQANSQVRKGDKVIWVGAAKTDRTKSATNFVVDLGSETNWTNTRAYCGVDLLADTWETGFLIDCYEDDTGLHITNYGPATTNNSGLWQQIMKEQNTAPAPFEITVKTVAGGLTVADVTLTPDDFDADMAKAGFNVTIEVPAPYAVTGVTIANPGKDKAGEFAAIVATDEAGKYWISGATGDVELNVTVAKVTYALDVTWDDVAPAALTLTVDGTGAAMTTAKTLDKGTEYVITFHAADNTTYAVDGVKATPNASGDIVMAGTLNADKTYVITKLEKTLSLVNSTGDTLTTALKDSANNAVTWANTALPISLNEDGRYTLVLTVPAYTTYAVAVGAAAPVEYKNNTATAKTENIAVTMSADVTVTVTKAEVNLKVDATAATHATGLAVKVNGVVKTSDATNLTTGADVNKGAEYTIEFTANASYDYKVDGATKTPNGEGKIVVTGTLTAATTTVEITETHKKVSVTVGGTGIEALDIEVDAGTALNAIAFDAAGTPGECVIELTDTTTPAAAWDWANADVTVKIGGKTVMSGYSWDATNHKIVFSATTQLNDALEITVEVAKKTFTIGANANITTNPATSVEYDGTIVVTLKADNTLTAGQKVQYQIGSDGWVDLVFDIYNEAKIEHVTDNVTFKVV